MHQASLPIERPGYRPKWRADRSRRPVGRTARARGLAGDRIASGGVGRWAALLSPSDLDGGLQGGAGLIELIAIVHNVRIMRYYRTDALDGGPSVTGSGRADLFRRAGRQAFDGIIVSELASLGEDQDAVRSAIKHLDDLGLEIRFWHASGV